MPAAAKVLTPAPAGPYTANAALVESWTLSLHGKAPRTVRHYLDEVWRFVSWLAEHYRPEAAPGDLLAVERKDVEAWLTAQRAAGIAQAPCAIDGWHFGTCTAGRRRRTRSSAAHSSGWWSPRATPRRRTSSPTPRKLLLKACDGKDFYSRRDLALIRLLLATGLRVSEVCDIALRDLDLTNRIVVVRHGKGDKARVVRFDASTAAALDRYKRARARHACADLPWLWIGHRGRTTRKGVPTMLNKRAVEAGIRHVHPHQMRHTWADRWLRSGGNEGDLQRLGGWESSEIMRRYGEARAVDRALSAYDTLNPMGQL